MATLIVRGPDGSEREVALVKRITSVGRDPENDVPVEDPALPATALHIHFDGKDYNAAAHDRSDMTVNGKRRGAWRLGPGDRIRVAGTELTFEAVARTPLPSARPIAGQRLQALETLVRFSERLLGATDLNRLLDELMDALLEVTHADKGFLILLEDGEMSVRAARNVARETIEGAVERVSDSIIRRVVETRRALVVADALHDSEWSGSTSVVNLKLCSVMCAPLMQKGEVFGVIYLGNDNVVSLFDERALELLAPFAAQASLLVQNAMLLDSLRRENLSLKEAVASRQYGDLIGAGASMREVYRRIDKVAGTDISVLVSGETGTGKEVVAREIHRRSTRATGPFVAVNCGAIPEALLESELFGHVKGAFTGAVATRIGKFQAAHGGTLFLDEIGDMPLALQVKILRALQDRAVTKVGDNRPEAVDLRVVAATNRVLEDEIRKGTFREDLYYRLNVVAIHLPPLRDRGEDVVVIGKYFLQKYAKEFGARVRGFTPGALVAMRKYAWPGNIRELENRVKKAVVLADRALVSAEDLDLRPEILEPILPLAQAKEEFQKRYINEVLERNAGNRTKTAKDLGVDPRTVFRHLEKLEAERRGQVLPPDDEETEA
ncbi:transcriptional regulator, NifA subfamily, Fis Family [Anaeromyxobacter sp. K]|uniref:Transcriptional regulator, NifA subfamily, Fis Family n=1 Tax=Anaeromyxobacter dehalogenans (strain ATCC BAA-258 / DSM 21875 / 2CP-1) TaxID=455488 RepID=B8JA46_ANAD2|nr:MULTISPECIES: sigma-54-dependent Fis family transcriptional regulator [Anaeromyxobacter]ACG73364.1 transcriptional regulator, NifA subfamily, Fis Family [Anaeromyxobacter sp. K]ACL65565.1 transcriptional regulator, NifA subfamily, Fis Family [Anaeromyxobacter dehalogenans 2CP-1]